MILWISIGVYLLWLLIYYRKNRMKAKSDTTDIKSISAQELSPLKAGYLLNEEALSYKAEAAFLVQEGYLEPTKEQKPYHNYQKTKKGRGSLDKCETFFINKILFPKVAYRSTRDGGKAPYAIELSQDKNRLQEMLELWAAKEQYIDIKKRNRYKKLFWTLFTLFGILYMLFVYLFFRNQFGNSGVLSIGSSLVVLFLGSLMGVYFILNLLERIAKKSLLSTKHTILLAVAIGLMGTNFLLLHKIPALGVVYNPFIALGIALLFTIATYLNLDFLTPRGLKLKEALLVYKAAS